ncbi:MAG: DUF4129 domain-containing protein [Chitinophagaceae bacterium]|nr:DUF4129 domain-containing protein [Chitinophagaceae bacterium]
MSRFFIFFFVVLLCCASAATAQVAPLPSYDTIDAVSDDEDALSDAAPALAANPLRFASSQEWAQVVQDSAFYYKDKVEAQAAAPKPNKQAKWLTDLFQKIFDFFSSGIGLLLFYALILGIVVFLLYYIFRGDMGFLFAKKITKPKDTTDELLNTEDLLTTDWATLLQASDADKRMATRYLFIYALQLLHQQQVIDYRKDKTNHQYYLSIANDELQQLFGQLMLRYEMAWYGHMPVTEELWQQSLLILQALKQKI